MKRRKNFIENQFLKREEMLGEVCSEKNKKLISKTEEKSPQHEELRSLGEKTGIFGKFGRFLGIFNVKSNILFLGRLIFYFREKVKWNLVSVFVRTKNLFLGIN